ncbi:unnamed protein product, partial [Iphiclides podalirius]
MFILLCMLSLAVAEPPVGDSYLEAAQHSHDPTVNQQYLPPDFTAPSARTSTSFNAFSNQYLPPSTRDVSQEYGPPNTRGGLSQEYGLPAGGVSTFRSGISQEYGAPITRDTQEYSTHSNLARSFSSANLKTGVSQRYGTPSLRNSPSNLYGAPSLRSSPSSQYGAPEYRTSNEFTAQSSPIQKYGVPNFRGGQSHSKSIGQEYGTPKNSLLSQSHALSNGFSFGSRTSQLQRSREPSQIYGTPARSLSAQHGTASARNSVTGFGESTNSLSTSYGVPNDRSPYQDARSYETANFGRSNLNTNAFASSYASTRSPSLEYGAPTSRSTKPSMQYGTPQEALTDQGYEYTRNALEQLNQEPANYEFAYKVNDGESGSDFGHTESRELNRAEGTYFVLLPDGSKQIVEYEADEDGFKPRISVEPADSASALAAEGPY